AGARREIARYQVEEGRFTGAVGTDDAGDRACLDRKGDIRDRRKAAEILRQLVEGEDAHVAFRRRSEKACTSPSTPPGAVSTSATSNSPVANRWKSSRRASTTW